MRTCTSGSRNPLPLGRGGCQKRNVDGELDIDNPVKVFFDETLADNYVNAQNNLIENVMKKRDDLIDKSFGDSNKVREGMKSWTDEEKAFFTPVGSESFVLPCEFFKVKVPAVHSV